MIMPLLASAFVTSLLALAKQYLMALPEAKVPLVALIRRCRSSFREAPMLQVCIDVCARR